mgnify:CR=1 FL=1
MNKMFFVFIADLFFAVEQLQAEVTEKVKLPKGYTITFEGEYQEQQEAKQTIIIMSAIISIVVTFLLYVLIWMQQPDGGVNYASDSMCRMWSSMARSTATSFPAGMSNYKLVQRLLATFITKPSKWS